MKEENYAGLDEEFVRRQSQRLEDLRRQLSRTRDELAVDEEDWELNPRNATPEFSSESNSIVEREVDAALDDQAAERLKTVVRALEKIGDGTYGFSDLSGDRIPPGRLEAVPEAIYTVEEAQRRAD